MFHDDALCSTYISLLLYYSLRFICNTRYLVMSKSYLENLPEILSLSLQSSKDIASLREHLP